VSKGAPFTLRKTTVILSTTAISTNCTSAMVFIYCVSMTYSMLKIFKLYETASKVSAQKTASRRSREASQGKHLVVPPHGISGMSVLGMQTKRESSFYLTTERLKA
jgi:hypothetical protein